MTEWTSVETDCAECGTSIEVRVAPDGRTEHDHFASILSAPAESFKDSVDLPLPVENALSDEYTPTNSNHYMWVYAECEDCCHDCNE